MDSNSVIKKILVITDTMSVPESGAKTNGTNHIRALQMLYGKDNVKIINLPGTIVENNFNYISYSVPKNVFLRMGQMIYGFTGRINQKIIDKILLIIEKEQFRLVFIDNSVYGILTKEIKQKYKDVIVAAFYHDVKTSLCEEWIKEHREKYFIYKNLIKNEALTAKYADVNLVLNERERALFSRYFPDSRSELLEIAIEDHLNNEAKKIPKPLKILFLGTYYYPNVHGIQWFADEVYSKLNPNDVNLYICGKGMEVLKSKFKDRKGIYVHGKVDSLSETYSEAGVVIGPIFEGGGMKVKTAEALSYGKCFIGTNESLMGYMDHMEEDILGKFIYCANTSSEYVEAIHKILDSDDIKTFNPEVYMFYKNNYSIETTANKMKKYFQKAILSTQKNANAR